MSRNQRGEERMGNKQQTAVEWLVKELNQKIDFIPLDKWDMIRDIIQQAKEMEKEQIEEAFANGVDDEYEWHINNVPRKNSETYYEETYGGGEQ
jgi:succinate dehydrogenase/fumarate reductase-like Fe-S protein